MLSQKQIDELLDILKIVKYQKEDFSFPQYGTKQALEAFSKDNKEKFLIDIQPTKSKRRGKKITFQERYNKDIILLRLDLFGPPHTNPDGKIISGNHLHIIREEFDERFAIEIPESFIDVEDRVQTLIDFLKYCKVQNYMFANMERSVEYE